MRSALQALHCLRAHCTQRQTSQANLQRSCLIMCSQSSVCVCVYTPAEQVLLGCSGEYEQDGKWEPMVIKKLPYVTSRECAEADKEVAALTAVKDGAHIQQLTGHYIHTHPGGEPKMYILTK